MCNMGSRLNVTVQDTFCLLVFDKWMVEKIVFVRFMTSLKLDAKLKESNSNTCSSYNITQVNKL